MYTKLFIYSCSFFAVLSCGQENSAPSEKNETTKVLIHTGIDTKLNEEIPVSIDNEEAVVVSE